MLSGLPLLRIEACDYRRLERLGDMLRRDV